MARLAGLLVVVAAAAGGAGREVSIIIDTSTSMLSNDRPRYTVQAAKIISDLLEDEDRLSVSRMPPIRGLAGMMFHENCASPADSHLEIRQSGGNRPGFKGQVDGLIEYNTVVNAFAAEFHTARANFTTGAGTQRMLLFVADAGGLDACEGPLTVELQELRRAGVFVAAINLGADTGTFGGSPGIEKALTAGNSEELIKSVAQVYQRFLGSKKVQTGAVRGTVEVEIDPHVKEAFLVVASDAGISTLTSAFGNPTAGSINTDYRGGGSTVGLDGQTRSYRMIKIKDPTPGKWRFEAPHLTGGYMLLQDYAVGVRLVSGQVPAGAQAALEWELYDERTGKRITDPQFTSDLELNVTYDGNTERLRAHDGVLRSNHTFGKTGKITVSGQISNPILDRDFTSELNVVEAGLKLRLEGPARAGVGRPVVLRVRAEPMAAGAAPKWPDKLTATFAGGTTVELRGPGDGTYTASWTPAATGSSAVRIGAAEGSKVEPLEVSIDVLGRLDLGTPAPVHLGPVKSGAQAQGWLDLSTATVTGDVKAEITTDLNRSHADLEIETPEGWRTLGGRPTAVTIGAGQRKWRVRLRAGGCPEACAPTDLHELALYIPNLEGGQDKLTVPLSAEIVRDPFLLCWWRQILAALLMLAAVAVIYGYIYPYRFPTRTGVQISPEQDLTEGFFYALRAVRAARIGFYRHARVFVTDDYRIAGKPGGAFVRLRAAGSAMKIRPENGRPVWRQRMDGEWEMLPADETLVRTGIQYRNEESTVFFDVRMK